MKRLLMLSCSTAFILCSLYSFAQVKPAKNSETKAKVKTQNVKMKIKGNLSAVEMPYPVEYSSQFIVSDPAYSKLVLDMWKAYDMNTLENGESFFADTVAVRLANGTWMRGFKEVMEGTKTYRSSLKSVESKIDAVISLHSIDKDEDWVAVWGSTKETDANGKATEIPLHELWRINKDGKINLMLQFTHGSGQ